MWIELETESYDDDEDLDGWCNDVWLSWLSPRNNPRLEPLFESVQRSLDEILQLEVELIEENTEVDPELWIYLSVLFNQPNSKTSSTHRVPH